MNIKQVLNEYKGFLWVVFIYWLIVHNKPMDLITIAPLYVIIPSLLFCLLDKGHLSFWSKFMASLKFYITAVKKYRNFDRNYHIVTVSNYVYSLLILASAKGIEEIWSTRFNIVITILVALLPIAVLVYSMFTYKLSPYETFVKYPYKCRSAI